MEIGTQLRRAREAMGLSLEDVQQQTKIHAEYLHALENDRFDSLPSPFYVRAFLRTYARCLGMDPQSLLDRYERLNQGGADSAARFRRARPAQGAGYRSNTGRFRAASPMRAPGPSPQGAAASERPSQHAGPAGPSQHTVSFRPSQNTGRFQTVQMDAVTGRERAVREETRPPVSSRPSAVSQQTGRFRSGAHPIVKAEGQALPQPRPSYNNRPPVSPQESQGKKRGGMWIGAAAVGVLLLGSAAWYWTQMDTPSNPPEAQQPGGTGETGNGTASAQQTNTPELVLKEVDSGFSGDLFELSKADEIVLEIKATQGESVFLYGENPNEPEETYTMKLGDARTVKKDKFLWFRLTVPSAVQIRVNGVEVDTTAQDVAKSYRIQLKK
ncbi:helix-turn-helix protein [Planifilum fimeticola]|uniref:Helix-turn-helix protein n=1 Tax=Planifilum fimeticola TaxID=201975 RepID=A0A2T0LHL7_9BACL|nr:helix-turn-helix transcriptional regulator [Planifilum fimeticola]PRX41846.1 helix-turn-helix protein [Planifilum fimeticola]